MEQRELRSAAEDTSPQESGQWFRAGDSMDVNSASVQHAPTENAPTTPGSHQERGRLYYPAFSAMS